MMDATVLANRAGEDFAAGYSCAQAVLRAFAADLDLDVADAARVAAAFGGGIGHSGRTCGAVTGALMALGLACGSPVPTDKAAKEHTYMLARRFLNEFSAHFSSSECPGLLGLDIGDPAQMQSALEQNLFKTRCPIFVKEAVRMAVQLLHENE